MTTVPVAFGTPPPSSLLQFSEDATGSTTPVSTADRAVRDSVQQRGRGSDGPSSTWADRPLRRETRGWIRPRCWCMQRGASGTGEAIDDAGTARALQQPAGGCGGGWSGRHLCAGGCGDWDRDGGESVLGDYSLRSVGDRVRNSKDDCGSVDSDPGDERDGGESGWNDLRDGRTERSGTGTDSGPSTRVRRETRHRTRYLQGI